MPQRLAGPIQQSDYRRSGARQLLNEYSASTTGIRSSLMSFSNSDSIVTLDICCFSRRGSITQSNLPQKERS